MPYCLHLIGTVTLVENWLMSLYLMIYHLSLGKNLGWCSLHEHHNQPSEQVYCSCTYLIRSAPYTLSYRSWDKLFKHCSTLRTKTSLFLGNSTTSILPAFLLYCLQSPISESALYVSVVANYVSCLVWCEKTISLFIVVIGVLNLWQHMVVIV